MGNLIKTKTDIIKNYTKQYYLYNKIPIIFQTEPAISIIDNMEYIIQNISIMVPERKVIDLNCISIGIIPEFKQYNIKTWFKNKVLYISTDIQDLELFCSYLVYELVKLINKYFKYYTQKDGLIEKEYVYKRLKLYHNLLGFKTKKELPDITLFLKSDFNSELYKFLFYCLTNNNLQTVCTDLFLHEYSTISMDEYCTVTLYSLIAKSFSETVIKALQNQAWLKMKYILEMD